MSAVPSGAASVRPLDLDTQETREWMDALSAVIQSEGPERAHFLLEQLLDHARQQSLDMPFSANTAYVNTITPEQEERSPGNLEIEERLRAYMRWNAMAMVVKANRHDPADGGDLGGHLTREGPLPLLHRSADGLLALGVGLGRAQPCGLRYLLGSGSSDWFLL